MKDVYNGRVRSLTCLILKYILKNYFIVSNEDLIGRVFWQQMTEKKMASSDYKTMGKFYSGREATSGITEVRGLKAFIITSEKIRYS